MWQIYQVNQSKINDFLDSAHILEYTIGQVIAAVWGSGSYALIPPKIQPHLQHHRHHILQKLHHKNLQDASASWSSTLAINCTSKIETTSTTHNRNQLPEAKIKGKIETPLKMTPTQTILHNKYNPPWGARGVRFEFSE